MSPRILCRVLLGVAAAHVIAVLALVIAVGNGAELRTLIAFGVAAAASGAWLLWIRERIEEARSVERAEVINRRLPAVVDARPTPARAA